MQWDGYVMMVMNQSKVCLMFSESFAVQIDKKLMNSQGYESTWHEEDLCDSEQEYWWTCCYIFSVFFFLIILFGSRSDQFMKFEQNELKRMF